MDILAVVTHDGIIHYFPPIETLDEQPTLAPSTDEDPQVA
jgi:hypothetical protein